MGPPFRDEKKPTRPGGGHFLKKKNLPHKCDRGYFFGTKKNLLRMQQGNHHEAM